MRFRLSYLVIALVLACGDATTPNNGFTVSHNAVVNVQDNTFDPGEITLRMGEHVTWLWIGKTKHSLHFVGADAPSKQLSDSGAIYDRGFDAPGIYDYYCDVHGAAGSLSATGMHGRITVTQ